MRELHRKPDAIIRTPVFLDATCSGIQHFAAMIRDLELGTNVNLLKSSQFDSPNDIYVYLAKPINDAINKYGEENIDHAVLSLTEFDRDILKLVIMTKTYNVSVFGIAQQLKSKFEKIVKPKNNDEENKVEMTLSLTPFKARPFNYLEDDDADLFDDSNTDRIIKKIQSELKPGKGFNKYQYLAPGKDGGKVLLTPENIFKIAQIINDQIFVVFPALNSVYTYFIDISKLMIKLNIPLTWITPNGIKITQDYLKTKTTKLAIKLFGTKKTIVLKETLKDTNNSKQIRAIIPNIIHSLDASHLMNVINTTAMKELSPVITVHDCFGTLPNKMGSLQHEVKKEFVLLYTQADFLETFHNRILQSIEDNGKEIIVVNGIKFVMIEDDKNVIPNLPKIGELDLKRVMDSSYLIS